jgi:hypothetical protein
MALFCFAVPRATAFGNPRELLTNQETDALVLDVSDMSTCPDDRVLERIRAEFLEMPGMNLKLEQVQRLCGIERSLCQLVLDALVEARFLRVRSDGCYVRFRGL